VRPLGIIIWLTFVSASATFAQQSPSTIPDIDPITVFNHPSSGWWWVSGQMNFIFQTHPPFHAPYSGENSLSPRYEKATSRVLTLFTGAQVAPSTDLLFDLESSGGRGVSDALGMAGFTNLDVVRNPELGSKPYIARLMLHQTIGFGPEREEASRNPFSLATSVPVRRMEIRIGKFSAADFFDTNSVGSDSHLQFMNWTVDNNGGYDYAADTRGYTWGALAEYHSRTWAARFGEMLMPKVANGIDLDWDLRRARAENLELEFHSKRIRHREGVVRLLSYVNHANMGDYREAVRHFESGIDPVPTIENTRQQGRVKYGFGFNAEQRLTDWLRVFARWGWNEGHHESFAYTEVNETVSLGGDYSGVPWGRKYDKLGAAFVTNGISKDHQNYLRLGGKGFLLGDGFLNYGRENIVESYYTAHLWRGVFAGVDVQYSINPGYNRDRGPVVVPGFRMHVEF
jgi:high affinity Mn2+ porin